MRQFNLPKEVFHPLGRRRDRGLAFNSDTDHWFLAILDSQSSVLLANEVADSRHANDQFPSSCPGGVISASGRNGLGQANPCRLATPVLRAACQGLTGGRIIDNGKHRGTRAGHESGAGLGLV